MYTIPNDWFLYINIAIAAIYLLFFLLGMKRGFLYQVVTVIATLASFVFAWRYHGVMAEHIALWPTALTPMQDTLFADKVYGYANEIAWFVGLYLVFKLIGAILSQLVKGLQDVPLIKQLNGILGAVLGILIATVWVLVISAVLNSPVFDNGQTVKDNTLISPIVRTTITAVHELGGPDDMTEMLNAVYSRVQEFGDPDVEAVDEWLDEHGYPGKDEE